MNDGGDSIPVPMDSSETTPAGQFKTGRSSNPFLDGSDIRPSGMASPGTVVGDYTVESMLGQGGCARVYLARHNRLKRNVALKVLRGGQSVTPEQKRRFELEAATLAKLNHPGIVRVYEIGEFEKGNFIALEFLEGGSLDQWMKGRPMPPRVAAVLVQKLATIIQIAHEAGVLHRDLKPANILMAVPPTVQEGQTIQFPESLAELARVSDFGLARYIGEEGHTQMGEVVGTPSYMAPEQASGLNQDHGPATDVYSLGAILYETLTGRPPFQAPTGLATILLVMKQDPVAPCRLNPLVPRDLQTICLKCLSKDPAKRYPTAKALAADLQAWIDGRPIAARPAGNFEKAMKWMRRNPWPSMALAASFLLMLTVILSAYQIHRIRWTDFRRGLQDQIRVADGNTLAPLLDQWAQAGAGDGELLPEIRRVQDDNEITARQKSMGWLNLALACDQPAPLMEWMEDRGRVNQIGPEYLPLVGAALVRGGYGKATREVGENIRQWANHTPDARYRLRILGVLANLPGFQDSFTASDFQFLASDLLEKDAGQRRAWAAAFVSVAPGLLNIFEGKLSGGMERLSPAQRRALVAYLVWFGNRDRFGLLILGLSSDGTVLRELVDELQAEVRLDGDQWKTLWQLSEQEESSQTREILEWVDKNGSRSVYRGRARANALLLLMIARDKDERGRILAALEGALRQTADRECRHHLAIYASQAQAPPDYFLDLFRNSADVGVQRASLWALGGYPRAAFPIRFSWQLWLEELSKTHRETSDPGVHAAIEWLVGTVWKEPGQNAPAWLDQPAKSGSVLRNSVGMKLARVPGKISFPMGTDRKLGPPLEDIPLARPVRLENDFYLGTREVTVGQFRRFRPDFSPVSDDPERPVVFVSLLEAAQFCNWLSQAEGIPPEEWGYPPEWLETNDWSRLVASLQAHRDRQGNKQTRGYRLPTETEWEYACRSGSTGPRSFGEDNTLLERFAYMAIQETRPQRVGSLVPNDFGLFDMLGNALEWTDDPAEDAKAGSGRVGLGRGTVDPAGTRWIMRGAGFDFQPLFFRSDYRYKEFPGEKWFSYGFRVAKPVP